MSNSLALVLEAIGPSKTESAADETAGLVKATLRPKFIGKQIKTEMKTMMLADDFTNADALHFLALHNLLHEQIYGVLDVDMEGRSLRVVRSRVQKMLNALGSKAMLEFVRWAWNSERSREAWRRDNFFEQGRMGAYKLFSRHKLVEYRLSLARQKAR